MTRKLDLHKRQAVSDAIHDAAMDLFSKKGYDETTVDDIVERVEISQRTFFRYFVSKDDLLAVSVVRYGAVLCEAVASSPADLELVDIVRRAVVAGVKFNTSNPRTRRIVEMSERSHAAKQAHLSRIREVEDKLTDAFGARANGSPKEYLKNRLLAQLTLNILHSALYSWFCGEYKYLDAVKEAFSTIKQVFDAEPKPLPNPGADPVRRPRQPRTTRN